MCVCVLVCGKENTKTVIQQYFLERNLWAYFLIGKMVVLGFVLKPWHVFARIDGNDSVIHNSINRNGNRGPSTYAYNNEKSTRNQIQSMNISNGNRNSVSKVFLFLCCNFLLQNILRVIYLKKTEETFRLKKSITNKSNIIEIGQTFFYSHSIIADEEKNQWLHQVDTFVLIYNLRQSKRWSYRLTTIGSEQLNEMVRSHQAIHFLSMMEHISMRLNGKP